MVVYDYTPIWNGVVCDPGPDGGQVSRIDLYAAPERTGQVAATAGPATRLRTAAYRFAIPAGLADGRYWCTVTFTPAKDQPETVDRTVRLDLPLGTGLVASAEQVADKLRTPLPLTAAQREAFRNDIADAQADVVAYLGRPLIPVPQILRSARPLFGYDLDDPRAWPVRTDDDITTVLGYTSNPDGTFDVKLLVGLDGAAEEPIVRYVVAHAVEAIRNSPTVEGAAGRRVTSVSAEGQSISYDTAPIAGQAGALPALDSLSGYRKRLYRSIVSGPATHWPYGGRRFRRW